MPMDHLSATPATSCNAETKENTSNYHPMITGDESDFPVEQNSQERGNIIRWKSGNIVDPRLLELLESFKEIYVKRNELFKKIFPTDYEDFVQVFKKFGEALTRKKNKKVNTMQRSLSFGDESELRLERFKVSTPPIMVIGPAGEGVHVNKGDKDGYY